MFPVVGLLTVILVTIAVVDAATVYKSGALAKAPCVIAVDARVVVDDRNVKIDAEGIEVTTQVPLIPVLPLLTTTMSPIANPWAADVETIAVELTIATLEIEPPTVTPELKIAEPLGVTDADEIFAFVTT
jgi:hypothetical protein